MPKKTAELYQFEDSQISIQLPKNFEREGSQRMACFTNKRRREDHIFVDPLTPALDYFEHRYRSFQYKTVESCENENLRRRVIRQGDTDLRHHASEVVFSDEVKGTKPRQEFYWFIMFTQEPFTVHVQLGAKGDFAEAESMWTRVIKSIIIHSCEPPAPVGTENTPLEIPTSCGRENATKLKTIPEDVHYLLPILYSLTALLEAGEELDEDLDVRLMDRLDELFLQRIQGLGFRDAMDQLTADREALNTWLRSNSGQGHSANAVTFVFGSLLSPKWIVRGRNTPLPD